MAADPRLHVVPGQRLRLAAEQVNGLNRLLRVGAGFSAATSHADKLQRLAIKIPMKAVTDLDWPEGVELSVGHSIGMPSLDTRAALWNAEVANFNPFQPFTNAASSEADLCLPTGQYQLLDAADMGLAGEQFGVIENIGRKEYDADGLPLEENEKEFCLSLIVGGVFRCRAIAFGGITDRLLGPPPMPNNQNMKPLWRPYPLMAPVGTARVLAVGAYWKIGQQEWPRVYECLVSM